MASLIKQYSPNYSTQDMTPPSLTKIIPGILDASKLQQRTDDVNRVNNSERFNYYSLTPEYQKATGLPIPLRAMRLIAQCRLGQGTFYTPLGVLRINYNEICNICNKNEEQSLWHILCSCPLHVESRSAFFKNTPSPSCTDLCSILNPDSKKECLKFARFVNSCLTQIQEMYI